MESHAGKPLSRFELYQEAKRNLHEVLNVLELWKVEVSENW